ALFLPDYPAWDGGAADNNWATGANWTLDIAPDRATGIVFPNTAPADSRICTNNIPIMELETLRITGTNYVLRGNPIKLHAGLTEQGPTNGNPAIIDLNVTLMQSQTFSTSGKGYALNGKLSLGFSYLTLDSFTNCTFAGPIESAG